MAEHLTREVPLATATWQDPDDEHWTPVLLEVIGTRSAVLSDDLTEVLSSVLLDDVYVALHDMEDPDREPVGKVIIPAGGLDAMIAALTEARDTLARSAS
jgi:hypothetical protein